MAASKIEHADLPQHSLGILQQFRDFWMEDYLCDVVLKSSDGAEHSAHAAVLSATSKFFKNLLGGSFLEADQVQRGRPVEIAASNATVSALLDYVYGGQPEVNLEAGLELLRLAEAYDLPKLAGAIEAGFHASLDSSAALKILQEAQGLHDLKVACEEKVAADFETCSQHPDFWTLNSGQLARILKREDLLVSREETVLKCIFNWLKISKDSDGSLGMLLQLVDFHSISVENLLRLGRLPVPGLNGDHLHREVQDALHARCRKRTRGPQSFLPKRRCLQHWSPDLGASTEAPGRQVLPTPAYSLHWHEGAIYFAGFDAGIHCWKPGSPAADARPIAGPGASVAGINDLGTVFDCAIAPTGQIFVADYDSGRLVSFLWKLSAWWVAARYMLLAQRCVVRADCPSPAEVGRLASPDCHVLWDSSSRPAVRRKCNVCHQGRGDLYPWLWCQPHPTHSSRWVLPTSCDRTSPSRVRPCSMGHVRHWSWNHLRCGRRSKQGLYPPSRWCNFHGSVAVSGSMAPCVTCSPRQIAICEHGGPCGSDIRPCLWVWVATSVAAWMKNKELMGWRPHLSVGLWSYSSYVMH